MKSALRVLVVEDEWLIATQIVAMLERAGHIVVGPFASAEEAEETIRSGDLDVALLDVRLAQGNSFAIADACLEAGTPFAFVTGVVSTDLPVLFAAFPILRKPYSEAAVLEQLRSLTEASIAQDAEHRQHVPTTDAPAE